MAYRYECPYQFYINDYGYLACATGKSVEISTVAEGASLSQEQFNVMLNVALQSSLPAADQLALAFGAGVAVMVPLYAVMWGIRAARDSIKKA